ncbi:CRAL-TRIO domain-containing protein [Pavlovales sp. CCMP2436]|nr:CRAL-TRIO domain-containing protein [Pavlovales sp. CCMP2436]
MLRCCGGVKPCCGATKTDVDDTARSPVEARTKRHGRQSLDRLVHITPTSDKLLGQSSAVVREASVAAPPRPTGAVALSADPPVPGHTTESCAPSHGPTAYPAGPFLTMLSEFGLFVTSPFSSPRKGEVMPTTGAGGQGTRPDPDEGQSGHSLQTDNAGGFVPGLVPGLANRRSRLDSVQAPPGMPHVLDERVNACYGESDEHIQMRSKLREALRAEGVYRAWLDNNHAMMRFMRARQFHFDKTLLMLRNCLLWRVEKGVDTVLSTWKFTERLQVKRFYQYTHHRTDKMGRVLYIEHVGKIDFTELNKVIGLPRLLESFIYDAELTATRKIFTILDMDGFRISQFDSNVREYLKAVTQWGNDYYPEQLGQMFIVNAPVAFRAVWAFIKPLLDPKTQSKIRIFSTGEKAHATRELLHFVDARNLPTLYGGSDESCDFVNERGPWINDEWKQKFA